MILTWSCFWQCANTLDYGLLIHLGYSQCNSPKVYLPFLFLATTFDCQFHHDVPFTWKSIAYCKFLYYKVSIASVYSFKLLLSYFNLCKTWAHMHTSIASHHTLFLLLIGSWTKIFWQLAYSFQSQSSHWVHYRSLLANILSITTLYISVHSPITCSNDTILILCLSI